MPSNNLNIQPISSWFYNCGLGTLVPHLLMHLSPNASSLAQFAETTPNPVDKLHFKISQGYGLFRQSFLELYILDEAKRQQIIENDKNHENQEFESILSTLFETYTKGTEQTIILGPVLRLTLQKVLLQDEAFKESLWPSFALLINNCLAYAMKHAENKVEGYKCEDTEKELFCPNKNKIQEIISTLIHGSPPPLEGELPEQEPEITKEMFEQDACPALFLKEWEQIVGLACAYIGSAEQPVYLSIEHLAILYRSFGFHLFHTNNVDVPMVAAASKPAFYLKDTFIINKSKDHWELVCQNPESVWEAKILKRPDYLYGTDTAFTQAAGDQEKYSKIIDDLQKKIQSFILDGKNVFMSECPEKIAKSWHLANPFYALAYKIDEILLIEGNKVARTALMLTPGFINFLSNFKDYYDIEDDVDIDDLITLLKQYPNPHERSRILSQAFSVYEEEEADIGEVYNSFGFDIKLSKNHIEVACRLTNHSETVFQVPAPLKAIEEIFLNFDGENWACLELKTLYSEFRNASLKDFPAFIINDEDEFQESVKSTLEEAPSPMTKSKFLKSLETQKLVLVGPKPQVNPKFYFIKDEQGNTALHKMAGLAQGAPRFVAIVTESIVSALLDMHEEQFNNTVDIQRGRYNFWRTNKAKETAVSVALRTMNLNWVQKFYEALIVAEENASVPWVQDKFREDLTKLRNHIGLAINNIITSDALFNSLESDIEILNTLEKYFQLDLILGNPFRFDDSENQFDFLKNCFSFANGDKNPFHLAFQHNRYDAVLNMFQRTIRRTYKEKVQVFAIDHVEAKIEPYIFAIVNEYGRTVESCKTLAKRNIASKLALKSWDQLNWQLDYSNKMKNTTTYKGVSCGKSALELSTKLGGNGSVNAGMTLAWQAAMPVANTLAPKLTTKISNGISKGISDGATYVGGSVGKTVGAGLDKGASYIPPKPAGEDASYYPKKYKQHVKDMTDISLSTLKKEMTDPKKNKLSTLAKYSLKNVANTVIGPGFAPPLSTPSFIPSSSELLATGLGIAVEKFSAPTVSDPSYYTKNGEYYGKKMGASAPGAVVTAIPWVLAPQVTAASLVLGLVGANAARYCLPDYPVFQGIAYTLMADIPLYKDYVSASAEDAALYQQKLEFNCEQFLPKGVAQALAGTLNFADSIGDAYKNTVGFLAKIPAQGLNTLPKFGIGFGCIEAAYNTLANNPVISAPFDARNYLVNMGYTYGNIVKDFTEKTILSLLPESEQSEFRAYQLATNKLARMQNNGASQNEIDAQIEEVELKYKNCIAGRTLNALENEFKNETTLKLELSRLEQEDILDEAAISHTKEALAVSKITSEKLFKAFDVHNDKGMRASIRAEKEARDIQVEKIKAQDIKANQSIKNYSAQAITCQEAEVKLFNLKENKASKADIQKAEAEVKNERAKLDALLVEVGVCTDATVVEQLRGIQQKIDTDLVEAQAKVTLANLSLDKFNWAAKHKITDIFGDYQADRSVYAKDSTNFILDVKDPNNDWSPEERQVQYDRIYKDIYNDVLYSFETRGPQRREFCRNKLHNYIFKEVKGCRPPLPDKQIDTWAKYFVNEVFYDLFDCEPFQGVAQHTDVAINARFFITTAIIIGTFGAASAAGMSINVGFGAGSAGLGIGAAIGGDKSDTFKAFGEGANGFQMSFNQPVEAFQLGKPNVAVNDAFSKAPQSSAIPIAVPFNPEYSPCSFSQRIYSPEATLELNLDRFTHLPVPTVLSSEKIVSEYIYKPTPPSIDGVSSDSKKKKKKKKANQSNGIKPTSNKVKDKPNVLNTKPPVSKPVHTPVPKPVPKAKKRNYNAELHALNKEIPNESTQAGVGLSALYHAGKNMVTSTVDMIKTVGEFSKNMQSGPQGVAKANETVRSGIQTAKTTADMLANPKKTWNTMGDKASELVEKSGQHLKKGETVAAGKVIAPFVEGALNVALVGGSLPNLTKGVAKAASAIATTGKKTTKSVTKTVTKSATKTATKSGTKNVTKTAAPTKTVTSTHTTSSTKSSTSTSKGGSQSSNSTNTVKKKSSIPITAETTKGATGATVITSSSGTAATFSVFESPSPVILSLNNSNKAGKVDFLMSGAKEPGSFNSAANKSSLINHTPSLHNTPVLPKTGVGMLPNPDWNTVPVELLIHQAPKFGNSGAALFEMPKPHIDSAKIPVNAPKAPKIPAEGPIPLGAPGNVSVEFPNAPPQLAAAVKDRGPKSLSVGQKSTYIKGTPRPHKLYPHITCESGKMYMPTNKHEPIKNGKAFGGPDASVNPIPSYEVGQKLLDTAYTRKNKKQLYNLYEDTVIEFQPSDFNDEWHAYAIEKNIMKEAGDDVIQKFRKDGLIKSDAIYNKLLKT